MHDLNQHQVAYLCFILFSGLLIPVILRQRKETVDMQTMDKDRISAQFAVVALLVLICLGFDGFNRSSHKTTTLVGNVQASVSTAP